MPDEPKSTFIERGTYGVDRWIRTRPGSGWNEIIELPDLSFLFCPPTALSSDGMWDIPSVTDDKE